MEDSTCLVPCASTESLQDAQLLLQELLTKERERQRVDRTLRQLQLAPSVSWTTGTAAQSLRIGLDECAGCLSNPVAKAGVLCLASFIAVASRRGWQVIFCKDPCNHLAALCKELLSTLAASGTMDLLWNGLKWVFEKMMFFIKHQGTAKAAKYIGAGAFAVLVLNVITSLVAERRLLNLAEAFDAFFSGAMSSIPAACLALGHNAFAIGLLVAVAYFGVQFYMTTVPKDDGKLFHERTPAPMALRTSSSLWSSFKAAVTGGQVVPMEWDIPVAKEMSLDLEMKGSNLVCPISRTVMVEPVLLKGQLYERYWIEEWLIKTGTDAFNEPASLDQLRPCPRATAIIINWAASEGLRLRPRRT
ncbi:hypothetical protein WJX74_004999 [Apatococcus lobatus]|uniref:U-box domain-containing protein n=1 Tax=Apatococcus lobatus TaxID=904363 RepID=A0AAW1RZP1_9CHLO